jgi:hypothetical protein
MHIRRGSFLGTVRLTFDRDLFTADPMSLGSNYALPVRIYESSADTILQGRYSGSDMVVPPKDYAVIVIKYISPCHGNYYVRGRQDDLGSPADSIIYNSPDLSRNKVASMTTLSPNECTTTTIGAFVSTETQKVGLKLTVLPDDKVRVEPASGATSVVGLADPTTGDNGFATGVYDRAARTFHISYLFELGSLPGHVFHVREQLIWRDTPLSFEQW